MDVHAAVDFSHAVADLEATLDHTAAASQPTIHTTPSHYKMVRDPQHVKLRTRLRHKCLLAELDEVKRDLLVEFHEAAVAAAAARPRRRAHAGARRSFTSQDQEGLEHVKEKDAPRSPPVTKGSRKARAHTLPGTPHALNPSPSTVELITSVCDRAACPRGQQGGQAQAGCGRCGGQPPPPTEPRSRRPLPRA
jgi:hypothetical protein